MYASGSKYWKIEYRFIAVWCSDAVWSVTIVIDQCFMHANTDKSIQIGNGLLLRRLTLILKSKCNFVNTLPVGRGSHVKVMDAKKIIGHQPTF